MRTRSISRISMATVAAAAMTTSLINGNSAQAQDTTTPTTRTATGPAPADILASVNGFRADLGGGTTPAANGAFGGKRREINWDAVPDAFASPNDFPDDFFNTRSPRGVVFSTPGVAFQVSAKAASGVKPRLGNLSGSYVRSFGAFSEERIFAAVANTITDVKFFVPGTRTPAVVTGFGAVFTDVDSPDSSFLEFYDQSGKLIATVKVPSTEGDASQSFAGMSLPGAARIARVRINAGGQILANGSPDSKHRSRDKVAMDDFIYGEPTAAS